MCSKKVVLAKGCLTEGEFQDFVEHLHGSICGKFTEVHHTTLDDGWVDVDVCNNGHLADNVAKNILKESLTSSCGVLNIKGWEKVVKIVD